MVREKLFIYMTYVVVKLEKILIKFCNLLENRIPKHLFFFYILSNKNVFFLVLPQGQIFHSKLKIVNRKLKIKKNYYSRKLLQF